MNGTAGWGRWPGGRTTDEPEAEVSAEHPRKRYLTQGQGLSRRGLIGAAGAMALPSLAAPLAVSRRELMMPMRDGTRLAADLYLPAGAGPFPCLLARTAFNRKESLGGEEKARRLAGRGYAVVMQNFRGRHDSEGTKEPFHNEARDGQDSLAWLAGQPWCNGRMGMFGESYMGIVQWQAAQFNPPGLQCIVPRYAPLDHVDDALAPGGAFQLTWMMDLALCDVVSGREYVSSSHYNMIEAYRTLPLIEFPERMGKKIPYWRKWVTTPLADPYWRDLNIEGRLASVSVPAFGMGGWYDIHVKSSFAYFQMAERGAGRGRQRLVIGPWAHGGNGSKCGDFFFGDDAAVDLDAMELEWFDRWLRDGGGEQAPLRLFIMGANRWRDEGEWPLAGTDWQKWFLHSGGGANSLKGDGSLSRQEAGGESPDSFTYDPEHPVPTVGGNSLDSAYAGAYDQRPVEFRPDVLCYTTAPFQEDFEVTGPVRVRLYAATDGKDTDWTAKLVDVAPSGYARILCDGIIRARYREGFGHPRLLEPGKVYEYDIDLGVTGNVFLKGHRLRLDVSSSNFPRFDRNPNTGHPIGLDALLRPARQTIHHSLAYPSHLLLPVIPRRHR